MENTLSISFKKSSNKTSIKHNNRDFENEDWANKYHEHIDRNRSELNQYLVQSDIHEKYHELFDEYVDDYNANQKRADRRIDDYYTKVKNDKSLKLQQELVIQLGTHDDFNTEEDWEVANNILSDYVSSFEQRNPNLKVYNAVIHNDEASPHLHLNFIPVAHGYKRGVKCRPSLNKALSEQGFEIDKTDSRKQFKNWRDSEVQSIEELMNQYDLERKEVGTNKIKDVHEYKAVMQELDDLKSEREFEQLQLDGIKEEASNTSYKVSEMEDSIKALEDTKNSLESEIEALNEQAVLNQVKANQMNNVLEVFSEYDNIQTSDEEVESYLPNRWGSDREEKKAKIEEILSQNKVFKSHYIEDDFQDDKIQRRIDSIKSHFSNRIRDLEEENTNLKQRNQELTEENYELKDRNRRLVNGITCVWDTVNDFLMCVNEKARQLFFRTFGSYLHENEPILMNDGFMTDEDRQSMSEGYTDAKKRRERELSQRRRSRGFEL